MQNLIAEIVLEIELLSEDGIRSCFERGLSPNMQFNDRPLIEELTSEYGRGPAFQRCVKAFVDHGLEFENKSLLAVLLNDSQLLSELIEVDEQLVQRKVSLRASYTPLEGVNLMHVCAEFNHLDCAQILLNHGADVNAIALVDDFGFGGQTPIFHTVNQNNNQSAEMIDFLIEHGADLHHNVKGLIWGKTYEWETLIPAVNPISYAMMGMLPQMHRSETTVSSVVQKLLKHAYGIDYLPKNVPNQYLKN